jgi:hypothetical protein
MHTMLKKGEMNVKNSLNLMFEKVKHKNLIYDSLQKMVSSVNDINQETHTVNDWINQTISWYKE